TVFSHALLNSENYSLSYTTLFRSEPLRMVAYRMAEKALTRLPVLSRSDGRTLGVIELSDLLTARSRVLEHEQRRERMLGTREQRSEEHTSELQSLRHLVCRLLLEK